MYPILSVPSPSLEALDAAAARQIASDEAYLRQRDSAQALVLALREWFTAEAVHLGPTETAGELAWLLACTDADTADSPLLMLSRTYISLYGWPAFYRCMADALENPQ